MKIFDSVDDVDLLEDFWSIVDSHVPKITVRNKTKSDPWISGEVRRLMKSRDYYRKKFKLTGNKVDWNTYKALRSEVRQSIRSCKAEYFKDVATQNSKHPGKVWLEVNNALGRKNQKCNKITLLTEWDPD